MTVYTVRLTPSSPGRFGTGTSYWNWSISRRRRSRRNLFPIVTRTRRAARNPSQRPDDRGGAKGDRAREGTGDADLDRAGRETKRRSCSRSNNGSSTSPRGSPRTSSAEGSPVIQDKIDRTLKNALVQTQNSYRRGRRDLRSKLEGESVLRSPVEAQVGEQPGFLAVLILGIHRWKPVRPMKATKNT